MDNIELCLCDFNNPLHSSNFIKLINHYIKDEMGGGTPHTLEKATELVRGISQHPTAFVVFARINQSFVGMVVSFVNFSTFNAKPFVNIHDVIVEQEFRGRGIARMMLEYVIEMAEMKNCCKVTLEVREDNTVAKGLYDSLGFEECQPSVMHYRALYLDDH